MHDLATRLLIAAAAVIHEKHDADPKADFATLLVVTDRDGEIETHRFDVANRRNGTAESKAAVDCRRGADRFIGCTIGTTNAPSSLNTEEGRRSLQWCSIATDTKNVKKDQAVADVLDEHKQSLLHPAIEHMSVVFVGHTRLQKRRHILR